MKESFINVFLNVLGIVCILALSFVLFSCSSTNNKTSRTITIKGYNEIEVDSDVAIVNLTVDELADTNEKVQEPGNAKINKAIEYAKSLGIKQENIKTKIFRITSKYEYERDEKDNYKYTYKGQEYYHSISIKIEDFNSDSNKSILSDLLSKLYTIEKIEVNGVDYELSDNLKYVSEVRSNAVKDAINRAAQYAGAANVELGNIVSISEVDSTDSFFATGGMMEMRMGYATSATMAEGEATQLTPKKIQISATVDVVIEIK